MIEIPTSFTEQIVVPVSGRVPFKRRHRNLHIGLADSNLGRPVMGVRLTGQRPAGFNVGLPGFINTRNITRTDSFLRADDGVREVQLTDIVSNREFGDVRLDLKFGVRPGSVISMPFVSWGCQFWYQPYMKDGINPFYDVEGNYRPEDVCGSWAVYDLLGNRKLMHIRRPRIFDGLGNEGFKLHPDFPSVGIPAVELVIRPNSFEFHIDPNWLASASLPITIDPNLGYDSIGATNGVDTTRINYAQFTEGGSGDSYDTIFVYNGSDTTPTEIGTAVYGDTAGQPDALIQGGPEPAGATGWVSAAITTVVTSASTPYWLAFQGHNGAGSNDQVDPRYDLTGGTNYTANLGGATYAPLGPSAADPANLTGLSAVGTRKYSVYLQPVAGPSAVIKDVIGNGVVPFAR